MEKHKEETEMEYFERLALAAKTLTQTQIDACAWAMGCDGCGWTAEKVADALPIRILKVEVPDNLLE